MPGPSRSNVATHRRERRHYATYGRRASTSSGINVPVIPDIDQDIPQAESQGAKITRSISFYHSDQPYYEFTNFAPIPVDFEGQRYPTAEHLFQAQKFLTTKPHLADRIRQLPTARAALDEASRLQRLQRRDWFEVNISIMDGILEAKFRQHRSAQNLLLATGSVELIEASPVDSFWGAGPSGDGRNELGKALMRLREKLRTEQSEQRRVTWPEYEGRR